MVQRQNGGSCSSGFDTKGLQKWNQLPPCLPLSISVSDLGGLNHPVIPERGATDAPSGSNVEGKFHIRHVVTANGTFIVQEHLQISRNRTFSLLFRLKAGYACQACLGDFFLILLCWSTPAMLILYTTHTTQSEEEEETAACWISNSTFYQLSLPFHV